MSSDTTTKSDETPGSSRTEVFSGEVQACEAGAEPVSSAADSQFPPETLVVDVPAASVQRFKKAAPPRQETATSPAAASVKGPGNSAGALSSGVIPVPGDYSECSASENAAFLRGVAELDADDEARSQALDAEYADAISARYETENWDTDPDVVSVWYPALLEYYGKAHANELQYIEDYTDLADTYKLSIAGCYSSGFGSWECDEKASACRSVAGESKSVESNVAAMGQSAAYGYAENTSGVALDYSGATYNIGKSDADATHEAIIAALDPEDPDYESKVVAENARWRGELSRLASERSARDSQISAAQAAAYASADQAYQDAMAAVDAEFSAAVAACNAEKTSCDEEQEETSLCMINLQTEYGCNGDWALNLPVVGPGGAPLTAPCNCCDEPPCECVKDDKAKGCECTHNGIREVSVSGSSECAASPRAKLESNIVIGEVTMSGMLGLACNPSKDPDKERADEILLHAENEVKENERHARAMAALDPSSPTYRADYVAEFRRHQRFVANEDERHDDVMESLSYPSCSGWSSTSAEGYIASCFDDDGVPDTACVEEALREAFDGEIPRNIKVLSVDSTSARGKTFSDTVTNEGYSSNDDCDDVDTNYQEELRKINDAYESAMSSAAATRDSQMDSESERHQNAEDLENQTHDDTMESLQLSYTVATGECHAAFDRCSATAEDDYARQDCLDECTDCLDSAAAEYDNAAESEKIRHDAAIKAEDITNNHNVEVISGEYKAAADRAEEDRNVALEKLRASTASEKQSCGGSSGGTLPSLCNWGGPAEGNDVGPRIIEHLATSYSSVRLNVPDGYFLLASARAYDGATACVTWNSTYTLGNGGATATDSSDEEECFSYPGSAHLVPGVYDFGDLDPPSWTCGTITCSIGGTSASDSMYYSLDDDIPNVPEGECGAVISGVAVAYDDFSVGDLPVVGNMSISIPSNFGGALHELGNECGRSIEAKYMDKGQHPTGCDDCGDVPCGCPQAHWQFRGLIDNMGNPYCPQCLLDHVTGSCDPPPCPQDDPVRQECATVCGDPEQGIPPSCQNVDPGEVSCSECGTSVTCPDEDD